MSDVYTVSNVMPTGKASQTYGTEYYVQFDEMADTASLWFKKEAPEKGQTLELEKVKGQWKKVKKEWKPDQKQSSSPPSTSRSSRGYSNNSDGQKQGMCINNATAYVNTLEFKAALTDREWAELVHSYATALYRLGDLKNEDLAETVKDVFSGK